MILSGVYLGLSLLLASVTAKLTAPRLIGGLPGAVLALFAMVLGLAAPHFVALGWAVTAAVWALGGLTSQISKLGLTIHVACWIVLVVWIARAGTARPVLDGARIDDDDDPLAVLYIHGGGWVFGSTAQARLIGPALARQGYVAFAIRYRLAPRFPLPAAVHDVKAAVAWVRAHAAEYGADPSFVAAIGGSAGGHLAALLALTADQPALQPGCEDADTSVDAVVAFYGVMDLRRAVEARRNEGLRLLLERAAVKLPFERASDLYTQLDPLSQIRPDPPPILMVHGLHDRMVHVRDSNQLCERLRAAGASDVHVLAVPYVAHAFDQAPTPAQQRAQRLVMSFLHRHWERHRTTIGI